MSHFSDAKHPVLGDISVWWGFESHGSAASGYTFNSSYDPGSGPEIYVTHVFSADEEIRWFMPNRDYSSIEELIYDEACIIAEESGWDDYDY